MNMKLAFLLAAIVFMIDYTIAASIDNAVIPSLAKHTEKTAPESDKPIKNPSDEIRKILKHAELSLQNITHIVNNTNLLLDHSDEQVKDASDGVAVDAPPKVPLLTDLLEFLDKENRQVYTIIQNVIKQIRSRLPSFLRPNDK